MAGAVVAGGGAGVRRLPGAGAGTAVGAARLRQTRALPRLLPARRQRGAALRHAPCAVVRRGRAAGAGRGDRAGPVRIHPQPLDGPRRRACRRAGRGRGFRARAHAAARPAAADRRQARLTRDNPCMQDMTMTDSPTTASHDDARAAARLAWARSVSARPVDALQRASADAGFRSYWRGAPDGIVMDSPPALEDVRPWLAMHAVLEGGGVRVPRILARDVDAGFLLLEDLGPATCLHVAGAGSADALVEAAVGQLLRLQAIACPPGLPAYD